MIVQKLKIWILSILGAPLLLLAPFVKRSMKKLEGQIENDPESVPEHIRKYHAFTKMDDQAYEELKSGNYDEARSISTELLKVAEQYKDDWNYGNALHHGNTVLGLIAIKEGKIDQAIKYLRKSGNVEGSPQLDSFGPSRCLAMELLLKDRNHEVIEYLESVESFWEHGYKELPKWIKIIRSGEIPETWQRLKY
ncbi:MAG: tetratricopeptide repeat protein [Candidatus Thiodiazotropha sp.]